MTFARSTLFTAMVATALLALAAGIARADAKRPSLMAGHWKGTGASTADGASQPLTLTLVCEAAAGGWGTACVMHGQGKDLEIRENDLPGTDPVSGKSHWFAVTNTGEVHDHEIAWTGERAFVAHVSWPQEGATMEERITLTFGATNSMELRSVVTANGRQVAQFTGTLSH